MPQTRRDTENKQSVIPVEHIRENVMPYWYQKPQNGFGSVTADSDRASKKDSEKDAGMDKD